MWSSFRYCCCLIAGYCCTMGPQSGCRQMVTARYLFGWWWVRVVAIVAVLGVLGWSTVNAVVGGEMLAAISNDKVPIWVGVLIVTFASGIVAIFGIKHVLMVETYFSVPVLTIFLLLYISSSDKFHYVHDYNTDSMSRPALTGAWLSFFCLCYSNTSTWGQLASDYFIYFPEEHTLVADFPRYLFRYCHSKPLCRCYWYFTCLRCSHLPAMERPVRASRYGWSFMGRF